MGLVQHAVLLELILKDVKVLCLEQTRVLGPLGQIGIYTPLADLVTDNGRVRVLLDSVGPVIGRTRCLGIDNAPYTLAPPLDTRVRITVKVVFRNQRPARSRGIEATRVLRLVVVHKPGQIRLVILARGLIAIGHHEERRVVAVLAQHGISFFVQPRVQGIAGPNAAALIGPGRALHL